jgi:chorismate synthase
MLRWLTAGESHGRALVAICEGLPAGVEVSTADVAAALARRRAGYGRGARMKFEQDEAEITGGVRHGVTLGSPVAIRIGNTEWPKWDTVMAPDPVPAGVLDDVARAAPLTRPRPGHADLAGMQKYGHHDARPVLERASARETAARVAVGAVAKRFLGEFGVTLHSHTLSIGGVRSNVSEPVDWDAVEADPVRSADVAAGEAMVAAINAAKPDGDTLGGEIEVRAGGVPPGLGSHVHWDRKLDGRIAQAICSINAFKAVGFGLGFESTSMRGSQVHDVILPVDQWHGRAWRHATNHHGGIEGGTSTGEDIVVTAAIKPIPTLAHPLPSVDLDTGAEVLAHYERSDVCVVPAGGVVAEAMVAIVLADAWLEKFGGDTLSETRANHARYMTTIGPRARPD